MNQNKARYYVFKEIIGPNGKPLFEHRKELMGLLEDPDVIEELEDNAEGDDNKVYMDARMYHITELYVYPKLNSIKGGAKKNWDIN